MREQICLVPRLEGVGGMVSFQAKLIAGLQNRKIPYSFDLTDNANAAILVIGGTRQLVRLWRAHRRGVRIVQRLNGMNWLHRVERTPPKEFLRAEINNHILAFIRRFLTDHIVYQSEFSQTWWNLEFRKRNIPTQVTYNGVDLKIFSPEGPQSPPKDHIRLLLVEGHMHGSQARGLETAVKLSQALQNKYQHSVELMVVGDVGEGIKSRVRQIAPDLWVTWRGIVPRDSIPAIDRAAHVLFSADLNAACPNSVIEALACGLPVIAYETGALAELVQNNAGEVVPYGADLWKLEDPQIAPLADACARIIQQNATYRRAARQRAEAKFGLDPMVEGYLKALVG